MYDDPGDDNYGAVQYDDVEGSGVLSATVRNVAILVAMCLGLVWITGGFSTSEPGPSVAARSPGTVYEEQRVLSDEREGQNERAQRATYAPDETVIPSGPQGHFLVDIDVNGTPVRFLVDTGATTVTLTAEDAQRVGLPVRSLDFSRRVQTANGETSVAPITLRDMRFGTLEIANVEATVTQAPLNISLLGMSFLNRLSGYEVGPEGLILRY